LAPLINVLHFNISTHFGLANLITFIFSRPKIIQFKMKSIFKIAILHLSLGPSEPCIFVILQSSMNVYIRLYDLKIIQKAGKETFSEKWYWIYFSFCYFAFHVFNSTSLFSLENFDPCNFSQGVKKVVFYKIFYDFLRNRILKNRFSLDL
jgi:hypothetical protein